MRILQGLKVFQRCPTGISKCYFSMIIVGLFLQGLVVIFQEPLTKNVSLYGRDDDAILFRGGPNRFETPYVEIEDASFA